MRLCVNSLWESKMIENESAGERPSNRATEGVREVWVEKQGRDETNAVAEAGLGNLSPAGTWAGSYRCI